MKYLLIAAAGLLWIGCNPNRRIIMKNLSGEDVTITFKIMEHDSMVYSPFFINNSRTVEFKLQPKAPYNEIKMSFGIGSWPGDTLAMITRYLENLEIKSAKGTISLDSTEIASFLSARRKGIGRRKIEIMIRE